MFEIDLKSRFMKEALYQAEKALEKDEVPIGAVIVQNNRIIGKAHNQTNTLNDPTAHAEMIAITQAAEELSYERLVDTELFVTIEPCVMCIGALIHARVQRIYFGARNPKYGACGSVIDVLKSGKWNHEIEVIPGYMEAEAANIMQEFFRAKRKKSLEG